MLWKDFWPWTLRPKSSIKRRIIDVGFPFAVKRRAGISRHTFFHFLPTSLSLSYSPPNLGRGEESARSGWDFEAFLLGSLSQFHFHFYARLQISAQVKSQFVSLQMFPIFESIDFPPHLRFIFPQEFYYLEEILKARNSKSTSLQVITILNSLDQLQETENWC